jgi:hypothetical protein
MITSRSTWSRNSCSGSPRVPSGAVEGARAVLRGALGEVEVGLRDLLLAAQRERALEDVLQLAHVAGEVVAAQRHHRLVGDVGRRCRRLAREARRAPRLTMSGMSSGISRRLGIFSSITFRR